MTYEQLLAALREKARSEQRDGYEWIVKPIQDSEEGRGELDPRVLEVHKETAARMQGQTPPPIPANQVDAGHPAVQHSADHAAVGPPFFRRQGGAGTGRPIEPEPAQSAHAPA